MSTEQEQSLQAKLEIAKVHIKFLIDYARRVAQHQITHSDVDRVHNARMFLLCTNEEDCKHD